MTIQIERIPSELEDAESSVKIYRILSYPADYTLEVLHRQWQAEEIIVPPFQRQFVWGHVQASRLIESFLMGLPVPAVFLYNEDTEQQLVIDGQQRLRSVFSFFEGRLPNDRPFALKDVNRKWEGKFYDQLDDADARRLRNSVLRTVILRQLDPDDKTSIYHVFERLNTGGTTLTTQEVRNCVYHGPFNNFLNDLNKDPRWRSILGASASDKRMRDVELIVRFFALAQGWNSYTKTMKDFISGFMKTHQKSEDNERFEKLFDRVIGTVVEQLGSKPFHIYRGLNVAVLDAVMVALSPPRAKPKSGFKKRFGRLLEDDDFQQATTSGTTDEQVVKKRISLAKEFLVS